MNESSKIRNHALIILLLAVVWFSNIQYRDLFHPDEGRYAEIPREMVASGDWLTPRLDDFKYFEKPALQYWATATAYSAFGLHNWTARLWSYLTGFGTVLLVWLAGRRLFDRRTGLYAAVALASTIYFASFGRFNTLDTGLTFFLTASMVGILLAQQAAAEGGKSRSWMLMAWGSAALAVLSKGLIGLVLPAGAVVLYTLLQRDWKLWRRLHFGSGLTVFLLLGAPWFILVSLKNPDFFHFFFIHEHFERFLTKVHHRYEPWWFFLPILIVGSLPWMPQQLAVLTEGWRRQEPRGRFRCAAFPLVLGGGHPGLLFPLRFQAASLHRAGIPGAGAAYRPAAGQPGPVATALEHPALRPFRPRRFAVRADVRPRTFRPAQCPGGTLCRPHPMVDGRFRADSAGNPGGLAVASAGEIRKGYRDLGLELVFRRAPLAHRGAGLDPFLFRACSRPPGCSLQYLGHPFLLCRPL